MKPTFSSILISLALAVPAVAVGAGPGAGHDLPTIETQVGRLSLSVIADSMVVSPDSSRLAFGTKAGLTTLEDKGVFFNSSGTPITPAPDEPGLPKNLRATVMLSIDDKYTPEFEVMTPVVFSPDSTHVAFAGQKEKKWNVVVDNRTLARDADGVPSNAITFSPDSSRVAVIVSKDEHFIVTVDDKPWPPIEAAGMGMLKFSPDSKHLAAIARVKANWVLFVDGQPLPLPPAPASNAPASLPITRGIGSASPPHTAPPAPAPARTLDRFGQFVWKPDSSGLGYYAAFAYCKWQIFSQSLDGQVTYASQQYDAVLKDSPIFSPDGAHLVFGTVTRNKWTIVTDTDESPAPPYDQLRSESIAFMPPPLSLPHPPPVPSTTGPNNGSSAKLMYLAERNKQWQLFINHQPTGDPAAIFTGIFDGSFLVSPDRQHYVFAGQRGGKAVVIRDGVAIATHDQVGAWTFAFSPDSQHLAYAANVGGRWTACLDGVPGSQSFVAMAPSPIAFSPNSTKIAYTAENSDKTWRLVVGKDGDYLSKPYYGFLKGSKVTWHKDPEEGTCIVTIAIEKKLAVRIESHLPD